MRVCSPKNAAAAGNCATVPKAKFTPDPQYSKEARSAHLEGTVVLLVVVGADGSTKSIKVAKALGKGLDEEAIKAVKKWRFDPGTYKGRAVPVQINVEVNFRLYDNNAGPHPQIDTSDLQSGQAPPPGAEVGKLSMLAEQASERADWAQALEYGRKLVQLDPQTPGGWNILGLALMNTGQLVEAEKAFRKESEVFPANRLTHRYLGIAYMRQENYAGAIPEFQKQLAIDPQDTYANGDLGYSLAEEKRCEEAVPNLIAGLAVRKNNQPWRVTLGECYLDLKKNKEGIDELQSVVDEATSPVTWNDAAYELALHNLELDRALKWAQTAVAMQSAELHESSLEHVTSEQLGRTQGLVSFWDTLGWVYFERKEYAEAEKYLSAGWNLSQSPTMGDHLGQTYEKLNRKDDAIRTYAMTIYAQRKHPDARSESLSALTGRLQKLLPQGELERTIAKGGEELAKLQTLSIANPKQLSGDGEVVVEASNNRVTQARVVGNDNALKLMAEALQGTTFAAKSPDGAPLVFMRMGTMHCRTDAATCELALLSPEDAITQITKDSMPIAVGNVLPNEQVDSHLYNSANLGISLTLPDGWQLANETQGSVSKPATAIFGKPGAMAMLLLLQEHLEATPDLYEKLVAQTVERNESLKRTGDAKVIRDGIPGEHWELQWTSDNIAYRGLIEFFSVGDQHFRIFASAADAEYPRYSQDFQDMLRSIKFPLLRVKAEDLLGTPAQQ